MPTGTPKGLHYANPDSPGMRRARAGRGFRYLTSRGRALHDPEALKRIRSLAIPPAWKEVWICGDEAGHIQAVGRDARGRRQYRYHTRWREARDAAKYDRIVGFAQKLPALRARTARDLGRPDLDRMKVAAAVVRLLEATLIRVGNEEYARQNSSYGLTTLRHRHVTVQGDAVEFRFRGKSGRDHVVTLKDARLAPIIKACQDLPGRTLFQYLDPAGRRHVLTSGDVNDYVRDAMSEDFSAKDFRTWEGSVLAARTLARAEPSRSKREGVRTIARAIETVSSRLGNTPAICRRSYVHPAVVAGYLDGTLARSRRGVSTRRRRLRVDEVALLSFLDGRTR